MAKGSLWMNCSLGASWQFFDYDDDGLYFKLNRNVVGG